MQHMREEDRSYTPLTARMALNLAAPHTWPAAIMPTLVAVCISAQAGPVSVSMAFALLVIVVLMQSAVNTFNDYYDFVKGTDDDDAFVEESDAVLVYNDVNPRSALLLAIGFLVAAFALGIYAIAVAGVTPLVIAAIGAVFVVLYSAGSSPISYLPLGEVVSGVVMGGFIPLAVYDVLAGQLDFLMLVKAIPCMIGVGLIMFTNNISDIERDVDAGRKTLPVLLCRSDARAWYRIAVIVWMLSILAIIAIWSTAGLVLAPFMLLASYPVLKAVFESPFTPERRPQSMSQVLTLNLVLGAFYAAMFLATANIALAF